MGRVNWTGMGLVLGVCLTFSKMVLADQPSMAVPTPQLVLQVQTADGQTLQAPVLKFKALSLAVIATLIKEGQMTEAQSPERPGSLSGHMTFYLDKSVSDDFVNWAKTSLSQTNGHVSKDSGEFTWPSMRGQPAETFKMEGLKVIGFIPADSPAGTQLVLDADKTEAFPPIDFSKYGK